jgi:hypothetical protein
MRKIEDKESTGEEYAAGTRTRHGKRASHKGAPLGASSCTHTALPQLRTWQAYAGTLEEASPDHVALVIAANQARAAVANLNHVLGGIIDSRPNARSSRRMHAHKAYPYSHLPHSGVCGLWNLQLKVNGSFRDLVHHAGDAPENRTF